jgi:hypothetical protein
VAGPDGIGICEDSDVSPNRSRADEWGGIQKSVDRILLLMIDIAPRGYFADLLKTGSFKFFVLHRGDFARVVEGGLCAAWRKPPGSVRAA